jgi:PPOX class probable FMN-dependent enzyme
MTPSLAQLLRDALDLEFADRPRVAALATVDDHHRPRARNVVVRNLSDEDLWIVSDARSEKNHHLQTNSTAELVFWLAGRREQFRLLCECRIIGRSEHDGRREQAWAMLNDATRALFVWPTPGAPRGDCDVDFVQAVPADDPIPDSFELLILSPAEIDHLELSPFPFRRTRYRADNAWQPEERNP